MITRNRTAYSLGFSEGLNPDVSVYVIMNRYKLLDLRLRRAFKKGYHDGLEERKEVIGTWCVKLMRGLNKRVLIG
jgi:hypothetical protein